MAATPAARSPWWVVFGATLALTVANGPIVFFTFGLFLGPITSEFGWDRATFASSLFVGHTLAAMAYPFMGRAIDRYGIRRVTLTFIPLFGLSTAAISLTPASPAVFIALAGMCGLISVGQAPPAYAKAVSAWFDQRRGLALGIAMAGIGIGAALVPQFARRVIEAYGWRAGYVALGVLTCVVAIPAVAFFIREPDAGARARGEAPDVLVGRTLREASRTSTFWLLAAAVFFVVTTINGIVGHLIPLLTDRGIGVAQATATLSAVGLSTIAGRVIAGFLLDRFFAPYVAAGLFLLPLIGVSLLTLGSGGIAPTLAAMSLGFGLGAEIDVIGFLTSRYFGLRAYGEIYGCLFAIFTLGTGLGPVLMALSYDATRSYDVTLIGFAVALVAASILVSRLGPYVFPARRRTAAVVVVVLLASATFGAPSAAAQQAAPAPPIYQVDPFWPRPLPNRWLVGAIAGVAVDARDHVWIVHRPGTLQPNETRAIWQAAPPVLEFDPAGNLVSSWGGPGEGYEWPDLEHGICVDHQDNVWLGGGGEKDAQVLKFTRGGRFLLQVGRKGQNTGSNDTRNVGGAANMVVDAAANELYVADGYVNHRVIVFDATTGAYKRHWGAYGKRPDDSYFTRAGERLPSPFSGAVQNENRPSQYDPDGPPPPQFRIVHVVRISNDGLVYVCDRTNDRIQVFRKDGTFVTEKFIAPRTLGSGSVWDIGFSRDPAQTFMVVPDGTNQQVYILRRDTLEVVSTFGHGGHWGGPVLRRA